jgi:FAD/FMN-containing dehydrogenase
MTATGGAARALRNHHAGPVHEPGESDYDRARTVWRTHIGLTPAVIAEASGVDDVRTAVRIADDHGLACAVQATGHGALTPADGSLLLKTSRLASIHVDLDRRLARVGPGARMKDLIAAAAPAGLAPVSGSSAWVGATGYTLGGGTGVLARRNGFAADNLLRAEIVLADGRVVPADDRENPDLFWALRGGGGNFGVVTSLTLRLHPVDRVYAGSVAYPAERAADVLAVFRDWALDQPDELTTTLRLTRMHEAAELPEAVRGQRVLIVNACYLGEAGPARCRLAPLLETAGPPLLGRFRETHYANVALVGPPGPAAPGYPTVHMFRRLPDAALEALLDAWLGRPDPELSVVEIRQWGGAMARMAGSGPAGPRDAAFYLSAVGFVPRAGDSDRIRAAVDGLAARLRPHATGRTFLNFLDDPALTRTAYADDDYRRLAGLKRAYDPGNLFRFHHNIPPATD